MRGGMAHEKVGELREELENQSALMQRGGTGQGWVISGSSDALLAKWHFWVTNISHHDCKDIEVMLNFQNLGRREFQVAVVFW